MGLFTPLTAMRDMIVAAPGLIDSANQLAASAQTQLAMSTTTGMPGTIGSQAVVTAINLQQHGEPSAAMLEPIAGVDLPTYAKVMKGLADYGYDAARLPYIAATFGIGSAAWDAAQAGWGERIQRDRAVGTRFNTLYTGA